MDKIARKKNKKGRTYPQDRKLLYTKEKRRRNKSFGLDSSDGENDVNRSDNFFVPERKIQFFKRFLSLFLALLQKMLISLFNFFFKNFFPLARHSSAFVPQNGLVKYYQIELQKKPPS